MKPYRDGLAVLFAMLFPAQATWVYFVLLHGSEWMRAGYLAGKVVQFGFPLFWVGVIQRNSLQLSRPSGKGGDCRIRFWCARRGGYDLALSGPSEIEPLPR